MTDFARILKGARSGEPGAGGVSGGGGGGTPYAKAESAAFKASQLAKSASNYTAIKNKPGEHRAAAAAHGVAVARHKEAYALAKVEGNMTQMNHHWDKADRHQWEANDHTKRSMG